MKTALAIALVVALAGAAASAESTAHAGTRLIVGVSGMH